MNLFYCILGIQCFFVMLLFLFFTIIHCSVSIICSSGYSRCICPQGAFHVHVKFIYLEILELNFCMYSIFIFPCIDFGIYFQILMHC